jgi:hypothetical protein
MNKSTKSDSPEKANICLCMGLLLLGYVFALSIMEIDYLTLLSLIMLAILLVLSFAYVIWIYIRSFDSEKLPPKRKSLEEEIYESQIPTGLRRLYRSESQKTKLDQKPIPGVAISIGRVEESFPVSTTRKRTQKQETKVTEETQVKIKRGGEFIGNRMRFKVKIVNDSPYVITDVTVYLLSYPKEALRFAGEDDNVVFSKLEPGGFLSPTFDFMPTQDCVKGEIVAGVSFLDFHGNPQLKNTKPFIIRSVCDLLLPQKVSIQEFNLKLEELDCGEIVVKIEEWTPEEMFEKSLRIVDESNFFEVSSELKESDGTVFGKITGFALGKYTGKEVGVEILISGPSRVKGASCTIRVSGEDEAMILPAIDDLRERLNAWLCPMCSSPLSLDRVQELRDGNVVECPFCEVTIGR